MGVGLKPALGLLACASGGSVGSLGVVGFSRVFGVLGGLGFGELGELEHAWSFEGFVRNCLVRSLSRVDDTV